MSARWELDDGRVLALQTPEELAALPEGTVLVDILGNTVTKGRDPLDTDTRSGITAFGLLREERGPVRPSPKGIWECKIGEVDHASLPPGCDAPMRDAVARAYKEITGREPSFIFSGWGAHLSDTERAVVEGTPA